MRWGPVVAIGIKFPQGCTCTTLCQRSNSPLQQPDKPSSTSRCVSFVHACWIRCWARVKTGPRRSPLCCLRNPHAAPRLGMSTAGKGSATRQCQIAGDVRKHKAISFHVLWQHRCFSPLRQDVTPREASCREQHCLATLAPTWSQRSNPTLCMACVASQSQPCLLEPRGLASMSAWRVAVGTPRR